MTYLSQPTCKRLEELGLEVPGDGKLWYRNAGKHKLLVDTLKEYGTRPFVDKTTLAYTHLDIIGNKENLLKISRDKCVDGNGPCFDCTGQWIAHKLLDTLLTGGDFEAELIKLLEEI